ncbi:MAG: hypothetical protein KatS3mg129_2758 [Leptospiraceae bacterium]|nr:MAG: hypothetical protein KatS3mg129_2758 [Leptospiraceae bacterium]
MTIKKIFHFIFLLFSYLLVILSFFPILRYFIIPIALCIILIEFYRTNKLKHFLYWLLRKQKKDWDVCDSKILSLSFYSLILCSLLFFCLWFIIEFLYLLPLKQEFLSIIK